MSIAITKYNQSVTIEHMLIVGLLGWWYTAGWRKVGKSLAQRLLVSEDFFSIDLLLGSLFAPFKQISASSGIGGTLQMKLQAWFDKQFSRVFGAIIRLLIILIGVAWLCIQFVIYLCILILWPLLPIAPLVGLGMTLIGVSL